MIRSVGIPSVHWQEKDSLVDGEVGLWECVCLLIMLT